MYSKLSSRGRIGAGCPPEIVDRERIDAVLRESECQLLVERMQAADVGQDHDRGTRRLRGSRAKRVQAVPILGRQHEPL